MDPRHLLSDLAHRVTRSRARLLKSVLIRGFARAYGVDLSEAAEPRLAAYPTFNAFFTRALGPGARPVDPDADALLSPCDGAVATHGPVDGATVLQAKGMPYSVSDLLGGDPDAAAGFEGGSHITVYLSPRDYHRVHMPEDGTLEDMRYLPGRLLSVRPSTVARVPRLFARNERVASVFRTPRGPMAVVLVGATLVGGIEQVWCGPVTPPRASRARRQCYGGDGEPAPRLPRGAEMGRFNMGSTVVVLTGWPVRWRADLGPGAAVRCGERLGLAAPFSRPRPAR